MNFENNTEPAKLVVSIRSGLAEREHFGYIVRCNKHQIIQKTGEAKGYPFFMRSCAKPLQAALIIDYGLDKEFKMTEEEIAICCASHAGEKIHINIIKNLLAKFNLSEDMLKCGVHEPISPATKYELLKNNEPPSALHNNCSGKHTMMLGLCKLNGWNTTDYDSPEHPLQKEIKQKIYDLCEITDEIYPVTKDGCGVPIFSMPLENMVKGYLNLFTDLKYAKIKNAFLNNPYIIGGETRTDTKIIANSQNLIAKVGAEGLCIVINTEKEEGFIVKICDSDMPAREFVTIDLINKLNWAKIELGHNVTTNHGDIVGKVVTLLN